MAHSALLSSSFVAQALCFHAKPSVSCRYQNYVRHFTAQEGSAMSYDRRLLFDKISVYLCENPRSSLEELSLRLRVGRRTIERAVSFATLRKFRDFREETLIARVATLIRLQPMLAIK
jgi:hypothetical protein